MKKVSKYWCLWLSIVLCVVCGAYVAHGWSIITFRDCATHLIIVLLIYLILYRLIGYIWGILLQGRTQSSPKEGEEAEEAIGAKTSNNTQEFSEEGVGINDLGSPLLVRDKNEGVQ